MIVIGCICMALGAFFVFIGSFGVFRFEDVYLRIQASSKSLTMGLCFTLIGAAFLTPGDQVAWKAVLAVLFQFLTAPLAANLIAQSARHHGIHPVKVEKSDESPSD